VADGLILNVSVLEGIRDFVQNDIRCVPPGSSWTVWLKAQTSSNLAVDPPRGSSTGRTQRGRSR
jgi:hypothetical protein